jgi:hypothetical protein
MRHTLTDRSEFDSPYIDAPVWPWSMAGWSLAALFVLLFLLANIYSA